MLLDLRFSLYRHYNCTLLLVLLQPNHTFNEIFIFDSATAAADAAAAVVVAVVVIVVLFGGFSAV